jgi:hypothetical protein
MGNPWPAACAVDSAIAAHLDPLLVLVGGVEYERSLKRAVFRDLLNSRDPFLPRLSKRARRRFGRLLALSIVAEIGYVRSTGREVLSVAQKYVHLGVMQALAFTQADLCTCLLEREPLERFFSRRLEMMRAAENASL